MDFWHYRFGGIPRKEAVTITSRASPDAQIDLKRSMDALTAAVSPLYDNLTMEIPVGNEKMTLGNVSIS
jgi:patched 2 protein